MIELNFHRPELGLHRPAVLALGLISLATVSVFTIAEARAEIQAACKVRGLDIATCDVPRSADESLELVLTGKPGGLAPSAA